MNRPTLPELAKARADAQRFLAANPDHELAPMIRVFLRATAPPLAVEVDDHVHAMTDDDALWESLDGLDRDAFYRRGFRDAVRHFFGGAE